MDTTMMAKVTILERTTELSERRFSGLVSEKRAVKPNTVVTPVEIRHKSRYCRR